MYVISINHMSTQYLNFIFSRKDQLKHQLQRDYLELSFHAPVRKNQIERIYYTYEAATAINMLGSDIDTSEISSSLSDLDHLPSPLQTYKQDSSTLLYKSKLMIIIAI